jgi:hypothetical protein
MIPMTIDSFSMRKKRKEMEGEDERQVIPINEIGNPVESEEQIKRNMVGREAAEYILEIIQKETDVSNKRMWEILRDEAVKRVGWPLHIEDKNIEPFTDEQAQTWQDMIFPNGKFQEMTVLTIETKEGVEYLERVAERRTWFQRNMLRYVRWRKNNPPKRVKRRVKREVKETSQAS